MQVERFGDWRKVALLIRDLDKLFKQSQKETLQRLGLYVEGRAKHHISAQDLGWKPLKTETKKAKQRDGMSTNILARSSQYFQSITSWTAGDKVYVGVKRTAVYKGTKNSKGGQKIANIAKVHEYGSKKLKIPARPLWRPTFKEGAKWLGENPPEKLFLKKLKKYL